MKTFSTKEILERVKKFSAAKTDTELASYLGIAKSTLSNWYTRNSIDYNLVFSKCEHINFDWLITGDGPMLKDKKSQILQENDDLNTFNQHPEEHKNQNSELVQLMDKISQQAEEIGRLKERIENINDSNLKSVSDVEEDIAHVG